MAIALRPVTGGSTGLAGIPRPDLGFGIRVNSGSYYYLVFVFLVVCAYIMYRIVNSHYGYALRGIHDNERRMQALGYNTWLYKYTSWIIAAVFGGVAGVLFAYFGSTMVPNSYGDGNERYLLPARYHGEHDRLFRPDRRQRRLCGH